jgi:hypothetical protein
MTERSYLELLYFFIIMALLAAISYSVHGQENVTMTDLIEIKGNGTGYSECDCDTHHVYLNHSLKGGEIYLRYWVRCTNAS